MTVLIKLPKYIFLFYILIHKPWKFLVFLLQQNKVNSEIS